MNRPSLATLLDARFKLDVQGATFDRDALIAAARDVEMPVGARGRVVEVPARDAREALVYLESAWNDGAVPLPSATVSEPRIVPALVDTLAPDLALVLRTSGSTGTPRHPGFSFDALHCAAHTISTRLGLTPDDIIGLSLPCDHGFGLVGQLLAGGSAGSDVRAISAAFPVERVRAIIGARVTVLAGVPFGLAQLVPELERTNPRARRHVRQIGVAGGSLSAGLMAHLHELFPGTQILHQYGCTEAGPRLTCATMGTPEFANGSVGHALSGVSIHLVDEDARGVGEVVFTSPMAMSRYVGDDAATARATVRTQHGPAFRTGDLGRFDASGTLFIEGRVDDVVKVRGEKVALDRVARVAEERGATSAFAFSEPAAAGETDPTIIVLYEGTARLGVANFVGTLPRGVLPRKVLHVERLPRLANGKVDRVGARASWHRASGSVIAEVAPRC